VIAKCTRLIVTYIDANIICKGEKFMNARKFLKSIALLAMLSITVSSIAACSSSEKKQFKIAYLPNESTEQNADARKGMAADLGKALEMEVVEYQASDYNAVIEAMRTEKVDIAYFGPLSFALAFERAGVEPIGMKAKNKDKSKAVYKSVLITKSSNNDINSIQDIKGKTMAFVDPNSTSGNMIPSAEIMKAFPDLNLTMDDLHTNGKFFASVSFSGKHQAGLQAVIKGDIQIAPISDAILAAEIKNGNAKEDDIKVIHESSTIPSEPMAMRNGLTQEIKDKLKNFILSYENEEYFEKVIGDKTARFIPCTIDDYKEIIELNKKLNK
jgi:phosphonate transport system substrate-binding protein